MNYYIQLILVFGLVFPYFNGSAKANNNIIPQSQLAPDEIVFYSNGSVFAPVLVLQGSAEILWTWDDNTTSNSTTPVKNYGTIQVRKNRLKVTPWSAVRRINIGYDAQDGGSPDIELVGKQYVSMVENINLVAPYLREWCSSYSTLTSLDFNNFINLETIECFLCQSLQNVNLTNTPKLKRICFEVNNLLDLDLSDCIVLEQVRASSNKFTDISLPDQTQNIWHMCTRDNQQLTNQNLFNDLSAYPNMADLFIWASNQKGELIIPKTNSTRWVGIRGYDNEYSSIDLRGSLQNGRQAGLVDMHNNKLTKVEIAGCHQIKTLDLSQNLLSSETVDYVLKQLDEFGPTVTPRHVNLSKNQPPTLKGLEYKSILESKGWEVIVDVPTHLNEWKQSEIFTIYPNPSQGKFKLYVKNMPSDGVILEITNILGQSLLVQRVHNNDTEWSIDQYSGEIFFVTISDSDILETKKLVINK